MATVCRTTAQSKPMFIMLAKYRTCPPAVVFTASTRVSSYFGRTPESLTWAEKSLPLPAGITEKQAVPLFPEAMMPFTASYTVPSPPYTTMQAKGSRERASPISSARWPG